MEEAGCIAAMSSVSAGYCKSETANRKSKMRRLFRPTNVILLAMAVAVAVGLLLWMRRDGALANQAVPRPVPPGDQEIVWLYAATQTETWERFVASIRQLERGHPDLELEVVEDANVFPVQTTAVPELAITLGKNKSRLWFRWYKLTNDMTTRDWVEALARRQPPPLAIIGGGSSDRAHDLATALNDLRGRLAAPPVLAITTATADQVVVEKDEWVPVRVGDQVYQERKREKMDLMDVYPFRSFRFCFTNSQMARAVTDFIWSEPDLRPDCETVSVPFWEDDPYSQDLADRYCEALHRRVVKAGARAWAWQAGHAVLGNFPFDLRVVYRDEYPLVTHFRHLSIAHSLGTFDRPNDWEAQAAAKVMDELSEQSPMPQRPLLPLPAPAAQPARRFLRGLLRTAPTQADRFVVALGDSFDFNTVYRDRNLTWPIQDLPFTLVFFCHRNPVDPVAFEPDQSATADAVPDPTGRTSSGTDTLLLYRDVVEALARAAYLDSHLLTDANQLQANLHLARWRDGRLDFDGEGKPLFDLDGNRLSRSGEHVVWLEPGRVGDHRVEARAILRVYTATTEGGQRWQSVPIAGRPELEVDYAQGTGTGVAAGEGGVP
jgi:hypothetical protein